LEDNAIRCRLLGFGDDFAVEEINGYKLLREDDGKIFYSENVKFPSKLSYEPLGKEFYTTTPDKISYDPEYFPQSSISDDENYSEDFYDANDQLDHHSETELTESETVNTVES
jgi:hypothetical protein